MTSVAVDVIVVGHPAYYPRFGFRAETARLLASPYAGEVFMALELRQGVLNGSSGKVIYPSAFDGDDPAAPRNRTEG